MHKYLYITFIALGALLLVWGFSATTSFTSEVSKFFTGSPTDKAIWMMVGGAAAMAFGFSGTWRNRNRPSLPL